jgi:hypothetical protein
MKGNIKRKQRATRNPLSAIRCQLTTELFQLEADSD